MTSSTATPSKPEGLRSKLGALRQGKTITHHVAEEAVVVSPSAINPLGQKINGGLHKTLEDDPNSFISTAGLSSYVKDFAFFGLYWRPAEVVDKVLVEDLSIEALPNQFMQCRSASKAKQPAPDDFLLYLSKAVPYPSCQPFIRAHENAHLSDKRRPSFCATPDAFEQATTEEEGVYLCRDFIFVLPTNSVAVMITQEQDGDVLEGYVLPDLLTVPTRQFTKFKIPTSPDRIYPIGFWIDPANNEVTLVSDALTGSFLHSDKGFSFLGQQAILTAEVLGTHYANAVAKEDPAHLQALLTEAFLPTVLQPDFADEGYEIPSDLDTFLKTVKRTGKAPVKLDRLSEIKDKFKVPTIEEDGYYVDPSLWYVLVRNYLENIPTLLVGPTGCAKTELLDLLAKKVGVEFFTESAGGYNDGERFLIGQRHAQEGTVSFDFAPFTKWIAQPSLINIDEINRGPLNLQNILLPLLDNRKCLPISVAGQGFTKIDRHEECRVFATANIGASFTGTRKLDPALTDRFTLVEVTYPSVDIEAAIYQQRVGLKKSSVKARELKALVQVSRDLAEKSEISTPLSTRRGLEIAKFLADGFDMTVVLETIVRPLYDRLGIATDFDTLKKAFSEAVKKGVAARAA